MLYIKGQKATEIKPFTLDVLKKISKEGTKKIQSNSGELDATDAALVKAADNVLIYSKVKGVNSLNTNAKGFWQNFSAAISGDYLLLKRTTDNIDTINNTIAERVACVLLFVLWNGSIERLFADCKCNTQLCLEYGLINALGEKTFTKLGIKISVVKTNEPTVDMYFDALKVGRSFVKDDLTPFSNEESNRVVVDTPHFLWNIKKELNRICGIKDDDLEEPERFKDYAIKK